MEPWQQQLKASLADPAELAARFGLDPALTRDVAGRYPVRLTPYLADLADRAGDPVARQFLPHPSELDDVTGVADPLSESEKSPLPAIVHRYRNRVLLLASNSCAAYCRFCTRKRRVGCSDQNLSFGEILDGVEYIAGKQEVGEVILSGGDPLMLTDGLLRELLEKLSAIEHVELVRIATRMPAVLPQRITPQLVALLRQYTPIYLTTHFNHPAELTREAVEACTLLADAGVPLANQAVLLRGVNDDREVLADLFRRLLRLRVRPYYLHQVDPVCGAVHFRSSLHDGVELMAALRKQLSGLAIPHYIVDTPGGHGKVSLLPENVLARGDDKWVLRAPDGTSVAVEG